MLDTLNLELPDVLAPALPASWGHPGVLPRLAFLKVILPALENLPLPTAGGFNKLELLDIRGKRKHTSEHPSKKVLPGQSAPVMKLPPEWAAGNSFPALRELLLVNLGISSTLPKSWLQGGLPSIESM